MGESYCMGSVIMYDLLTRFSNSYSTKLFKNINGLGRFLNPFSWINELASRVCVTKLRGEHLIVVRNWSISRGVLFFLPSNLGDRVMVWRIFAWLKSEVPKFSPHSLISFFEFMCSLIQSLWEKDYCTHSSPSSAPIVYVSSLHFLPLHSFLSFILLRVKLAIWVWLRELINNRMRI